MNLYRTAKGRFVGTQAEARKSGKGWVKVSVPTVKADLIDYLNDLTGSGRAAAPPETGRICEQSWAYQRGRSDAEHGMTTNPYSTPELRADWARGHDDAHELGLIGTRRFGASALPRFAPRPTKRRKAKAEKACTTARCRANRNRKKGLLG